MRPVDITDRRSLHGVAERNGAIVGFYALACPDSPDCELDALFVAPAHIGGGVGRALFRHAVRAAAKAGFARMLIQSDPNAEYFYRAAGAEAAGWRASASIPGRQLPVFTIDLVKAPMR